MSGFEAVRCAWKFERHALYTNIHTSCCQTTFQNLYIIHTYVYTYKCIHTLVNGGQITNSCTGRNTLSKYPFKEAGKLNHHVGYTSTNELAHLRSATALVISEDLLLSIVSLCDCICVMIYRMYMFIQNIHTCMSNNKMHEEIKSL